MKLEETTLTIEFTQESQDTTNIKHTEKAANAANDKAKAEMASVLELYSNLIMEKARHPWTKIASEQINSTPWTDIQGNKHAVKC